MISLNKILAILVVHFIADFSLQTDWMAMNKSKRMIPLLAHYAVLFFVSTKI